MNLHVHCITLYMTSRERERGRGGVREGETLP